MPTPYLSAIDLVTNSILTIQTVESVSVSDRLLGDIASTEITVFTNDRSGNNVETDGEVLLTLPVIQEGFDGSYRSFYGSVSINVGARTIFVENVGVNLSSSIESPNYTDRVEVDRKTLFIDKSDLSGMNVLASKQLITVYHTNRKLMLKNNDPLQVAEYNNPGKFQQIEEVTKENDPRLLTVRVPNFIVGVTGEETQAPTGGPPQIWY
jgi:hypothetical protein